MTTIKYPERFAKSVAKRTLDIFGQSPWDWMHFDDLVQIAMFTIWEKDGKISLKTGMPYGSCYIWRASMNRGRNYLQKQRKDRSDRRTHKPMRCVPDPTAAAEYNDLVDTALQHLRGDGREQNLKDTVVFTLWLEHSNATEISARCPWLTSTDSAEAALIRIFEDLRDTFGGETMAPVIIRRRKFIGPRPNRKRGRGAAQSAYQSAYYQKHRTERIAATTAARQKRKEAQKQRTVDREIVQALHVKLLDLGYVRYGVANSGASVYYVHAQSGFRVRVSDHAPLVEDENNMFLVYVDEMISVEDEVEIIEERRKS